MAEQDDAVLNARISKARSELAQIHEYIDRARQPRAGSGGSSPPSASARLRQLSRSEHSEAAAGSAEDSGRRTDRMRLAELSDVRNERLGRARLSPVGRVRSNTSPRTSAKLLGAYSKDFVQQALDFDGVEDDGGCHDDAAARSDLRLPAGEEDARSPLELRKYVQQMEETIAQLVQQKDELLRNQAEFDKHASGIFPSLEHLNHQLSQIVQGKLGLPQSHGSRAGEDGGGGGGGGGGGIASKGPQAEDVLDELRVQRALVQELDADAKRRKYDAELQEQARATEMSHVKGQIVALVAGSKLLEEKTELLADALKKVERELGESARGLLQRYQLLDKRVNQLQTPLASPRLIPARRMRSRLLAVLSGGLAVLVLLVAIAVAVAVAAGDSCGPLRTCRPLT